MSEREISPLEDRLLNEAVANTEKELFDAAMDAPEKEDSDDGDRSAEEMEDDLGAEADASEKSEDEADAGEDRGKEDGAEEEDDQNRDERGRFTSDKAAKGEGEDKGQMIPRARLAEEANKRRETEEARKADEERHRSEITALNKRFDEMMARLATQLQQQQPQPAKQEAPQQAQKPDMFTDPEGYEKWVLQQARTEAASQAMDVYQQRFVESSMADAHETHGEEFVKAYESLTGINPVTKQVMRQVDRNDPMTRAEVARVVNAPNPGRALMNWHKQQQTLQRVGSDPAKFEEKVRNETREALMKDPEFRKQLLADMKGEAAQADNGRPRNITRFPKSLGDASGSQSAQRLDPADFDGSEEGIFESVWVDRRAG